MDRTRKKVVSDFYCNCYSKSRIFYIYWIFSVPISPFFPFVNSIPYMLNCLLLSHRLLRLYSFSFFSLFFSHWVSIWIITIALHNYYCDLFFCSINLLLSTPSEFFISVIVLFSSRICIWFIFIVSMALLLFLIFSLVMCIFFFIF